MVLPVLTERLLFVVPALFVVIDEELLVVVPALEDAELDEELELEELDDVQNVYTSMEVSDEVAAQLDEE